MNMFTVGEELPNLGVWQHTKVHLKTVMYFAKRTDEVSPDENYIHVRNVDGNRPTYWHEYRFSDFSRDFVLYKDVEDLRIAKLKALFIILHSLNEQNTVNEMLIELEI